MIMPYKETLSELLPVIDKIYSGSQSVYRNGAGGAGHLPRGINNKANSDGLPH